MIIRFYTGDSITVREEVGEMAKAARDQGAEWVVLNGNDYRVSDIKRFEKGNSAKIKTIAELGLPDLEVPLEMQEAYDKRTLGYETRKNLGNGK